MSNNELIKNLKELKTGDYICYTVQNNDKDDIFLSIYKNFDGTSNNMNEYMSFLFYSPNAFNDDEKLNFNTHRKLIGDNSISISKLRKASIIEKYCLNKFLRNNGYEFKGNGIYKIN